MGLIGRAAASALALAALMLVIVCGTMEIAMRKALRAKGPPLASRTEISFRVDDSFTAAERAAILKSFRRIGQVSGCVGLKASFERIGLGEILSWRKDRHATIHRASDPTTWRYRTARRLVGSGSYMGVAMITTGDVFIMASFEDDHDDFENTVTHEVLHVVFRDGWHSKDPDSLMYHSIGGGGQRFLAAEAARLRTLCALAKPPAGGDKPR